LRRLLIVAFILVVLFFVVIIPSQSFQNEWNEWQSVDKMGGEIKIIENNPVGNRTDPAVVALEDEKVFIWGGRQTNSDSGAIYDIKTDSWEDVPPSPGTIGRYATSHVWTGEEVFIWGGHTTGEATSQDFNFDTGGVAYNPVSKSWRVLPEAPYGLMSAKAIAFDDGVLIAGGSGATFDGKPWSNLWFDLETDTWNEIDTNFFAHNFIESYGRVLAVGSLKGNIMPGMSQSSESAVYEFDVDMKTWTQLTQPLEARWMAVAPNKNGDIT